MSNWYSRRHFFALWKWPEYAGAYRSAELGIDWGVVVFERDNDAQVTGFAYTGMRIRHLRYHRVR